MMVGLNDPTSARFFCVSLLVRYITRSAAASGFFEYFDTASCQPPSVPALRPAAPPLGNGAMPTLPCTGLSAPCASDQAYGQLRMKAALPLWNTPRASSSP